MDSYSTIEYYKQQTKDLMKLELCVCNKPFVHPTIEGSSELEDCSELEKKDNISNIVILSSN